MTSDGPPKTPPSGDVPKMTPSAGIPKMTPSAGIPRVTPSAGIPRVTPSAGIPRVTPSAGIPSQRPQDIGVRFLIAIYSLLRTAGIHDFNNRALDTPTNQTFEVLSELFDTDLNKIAVVVIDGQYYLGDERVHLLMEGDQRVEIDRYAPLAAALGDLVTALCKGVGIDHGEPKGSTRRPVRHTRCIESRPRRQPMRWPCG